MKAKLLTIIFLTLILSLPSVAVALPVQYQLSGTGQYINIDGVYSVSGTLTIDQPEEFSQGSANRDITKLTMESTYFYFTSDNGILFVRDHFDFIELEPVISGTVDNMEKPLISEGFEFANADNVPFDYTMDAYYEVPEYIYFSNVVIPGTFVFDDLVAQKVTPVPEPATLILLSSGMVGVVGLSSRRRKAKTVRKQRFSA